MAQRKEYQLKIIKHKAQSMDIKGKKYHRLKTNIVKNGNIFQDKTAFFLTPPGILESVDNYYHALPRIILL